MGVCRKFLIRRPKAPRRCEPDKAAAAARALSLMHKYNVRVVTTKKSDFCRLSSVLYGDPQADLQHHCRAVVRATREPG